MPDPFFERDQLDSALEFAGVAARRYLEDIGTERVLNPDSGLAIGRWGDPMPERGAGTLAALTKLADRGCEVATRSSGPRFFHFVMGGGTPAALGADWLTSAYDQVAYAWAASPFAARLEQVAVDWLRQLFECPVSLEACSRRERRWRTSWRWRRPATGGVSYRGSTSRLMASPRCPRRESCRAAICIQASCKPSECSG